MIEKLQKYMGDFEEQSLLPSFFDPRYLHQLATHDKISAVNAIKKLLPRPDPPAMAHQPKLPPKPKSFFDTFAPHTQAAPSSLDTVTKGFPELAEYVTIFSIQAEDDPLRWWACNQTRFPNLAVLARDHLAMLASTVPSEETFSAAGNMVTAKRSSMKPETVQALMIAQSWRKYERGLKLNKC